MKLCSSETLKTEGADTDTNNKKLVNRTELSNNTRSSTNISLKQTAEHTSLVGSLTFEPFF